MKYTGGITPLQCILTNSTCYNSTSKMTVKGVLWHSTGANNPWIKRYVQPSSNDSNRSALLTKIGTNLANNDWNHISADVGVNAFIGKLADGTVSTVQTLPWDYKPWGCGSGSKGSCNNGWIQFEICEDGLSDKTYFDKIYTEACELTAYLCKKYNLSPNSTTLYNGIKVPVILCHSESYTYGLGSNHSDVMHWFKKYGKTMDDVRTDVLKIMGGKTVTVDSTTTVTTDSLSSLSQVTSSNCLGKGDTGTAVKELQTALNKLGYNCGTADGDFGSATYAAVINFQKANGLTADGLVGPATVQAINSALNGTSSGTTTSTTVTVNSSFTAANLIKIAAAEIGYKEKSSNSELDDKTANAGSGNWTKYARDLSSAGYYNVNGMAWCDTFVDWCFYQAADKNATKAKTAQCSSTASAACSASAQAYKNQNRWSSSPSIGAQIFFNVSGGINHTGIVESFNASSVTTIEGNTSDCVARRTYPLSSSTIAGYGLPIFDNSTTTQTTTNTTTTFTKYIVRINTDILNVRKEPNDTSTITTKVKKNEAYTIVAEENGYGKLKSGAGWINLSYCIKL